MWPFKKTSPKEKLSKKYRKLLEESKSLSTINRKEADRLYAEAEEVLDQIKTLEENESA